MLMFVFMLFLWRKIESSVIERTLILLLGLIAPKFKLGWGVRRGTEPFSRSINNRTKLPPAYQSVGLIIRRMGKA
jgi:hypothetical protein